MHLFQPTEGVPATFTVDASKTELSMLDVKLKSDKGVLEKPKIKVNTNGIHEVTYMPTPAGSNMQIDVTYGGKPIQGSPFKVKVRPNVSKVVNEPKVDPSKVVISGPGVAPKCTASFPTDFTVDTSKAGYGDLEVQVLVRAKFLIHIMFLYCHIILTPTI